MHLDTRLPEVEIKDYPVPRIFLVDPSGSFREWKTVAMGKNSMEINQYLEKNYVQNMEVCAHCARAGSLLSSYMCPFVCLCVFVCCVSFCV